MSWTGRRDLSNEAGRVRREFEIVDAVSNDLMKPLGIEASQATGWPFRLPVRQILGASLFVAIGGLAAYLALVDDPLGGEPHALVPIASKLPGSEPDERWVQDAAPPGPTDVASDPDTRPRASANEVESASGVSVVRPDGAGPPPSLVIKVPPASGLNPAPDPRLVERTRNGVLPRIGADGARPAEVYARPAGTLPGGARPIARVAIVVGGLGIGQTATTAAITRLPAAVTLAFAPYGSDLEQQVTRARQDGHEVMLQAPMEPFDYPDNDPGPHTLTAAAKAQDNLERLHWVMARFTGYVGLVNFMGARLTAQETALAPILREIGARGLLFLDDGSSSRSLVGTVGATLRTPTARADIVLDTVARADAVDKELERLEQTARRRGLAIASASALPVTVDRIAQWARTLESRGVLLVPISSAFVQGEQR
jgi:polysaccharide deacetylase 2 family uncharacterized protein YibQ